MKIQTTQSQPVNKTRRRLKVRAGYKKYNDYSKIYCLDSENCLFAVQAIGKDRIRFTITYNYSEVMLLSLDTALNNLKNAGGKVLLEEIEP